MDLVKGCTCALSGCSAFEDMLELAPCPPPGFYTEFAGYALGVALCLSEVCKIAVRCMTTFPTYDSSQIIQNICFPTPPTTTTTVTTTLPITTSTTTLPLSTTTARKFIDTPSKITETSSASSTTRSTLTTSTAFFITRPVIPLESNSEWILILIGALAVVFAVTIAIVVIKRRCTARLYQVASLRCSDTICLCIDENGDRTGIVSDEDHGHYIAHFETKTENVRFSAGTGECFTKDEVHKSVLKQNTKKLSVHFADKAELVYTSTKHVSEITFKTEIQENLETDKSHSSLTQTEPLYEDKLKGNVRLSDGDDDDDDDNEEREEKEGDDDDDDDDDGDEEDYDDDDDDEDDDDDDGDDDDEYEEEDDNGDYYYNYHDDHDNDKDNNDDDGRDDVVVGDDDD